MELLAFIMQFIANITSFVLNKHGAHSQMHDSFQRHTTCQSYSSCSPLDGMTKSQDDDIICLLWKVVRSTKWVCVTRLADLR